MPRRTAVALDPTTGLVTAPPRSALVRVFASLSDQQAYPPLYAGEIAIRSDTGALLRADGNLAWQNITPIAYDPQTGLVTTPPRSGLVRVFANLSEQQATPPQYAGELAIRTDTGAFIRADVNLVWQATTITAADITDVPNGYVSLIPDGPGVTLQADAGFHYYWNPSNHANVTIALPAGNSQSPGAFTTIHFATAFSGTITNAIGFVSATAGNIATFVNNGTLWHPAFYAPFDTYLTPATITPSAGLATWTINDATTSQAYLAHTGNLALTIQGTKPQRTYCLTARVTTPGSLTITPPAGTTLVYMAGADPSTIADLQAGEFFTLAFQRIDQYLLLWISTGTTTAP